MKRLPSRFPRLASAHSLLVVGLVGLLVVGLPARAQPAAATPHGAVTLVHRFAVPPRVAWGAIVVPLAPGQWRLGHAEGPIATESQLRAVLSRLSAIELGGRCTGWVEGLTSYPCGFAVADLDLAGLVEERFAAIAFDRREDAASELHDGAPDRRAGPDLGAHGLISPVLDRERFVALRAPTRYLGDLGRAYGGRMQFRFRAVTNTLVPSLFDRASGAVVLRSDAPAAKRASAGERRQFDQI